MLKVEVWFNMKLQIYVIMTVLYMYCKIYSFDN